MDPVFSPLWNIVKIDYLKTLFPMTWGKGEEIFFLNEQKKKDKNNILLAPSNSHIYYQYFRSTIQSDPLNNNIWCVNVKQYNVTVNIWITRIKFIVITIIEIEGETVCTYNILSIKTQKMKKYDSGPMFPKEIKEKRSITTNYKWK